MIAPALDAQRVIVVGAGPAGLTAARWLRAAGVGRVTVLEREPEPGGVPRHTDHLGYGIRDLRRLTTGPRYARRLVAAAERAGANIRCTTTVVGIEHAGDELAVTLADGEVLFAGAVVLATGVRERPRSARLVPGDRPRGVFTTGSVQQLTALHGQSVGTRAVVVGAEHVSFSAIWSLRHGGCRTVAMVTELPRHQTYAPLRWASASRFRVPVHTGVGVADIVGRGRVEAVVLTDGSRIACDTVVFTGDWIPDHELARRTGTTMTPAKGPAIDASFRTSQEGVFAIGNLVHPAETADRCGLDGKAVADAVVTWLTRRHWPEAVPAIEVDAPLRWAAHTAAGITVRTAAFTRGRLQVEVDGAAVFTGRRRRFVPNRSIMLPRRALQPTATDASHRVVVRIVR